MLDVLADALLPFTGRKSDLFCDLDMYEVQMKDWVGGGSPTAQTACKCSSNMLMASMMIHASDENQVNKIEQNEI